jgi:hypothetical protein
MADAAATATAAKTAAVKTEPPATWVPPATDARAWNVAFTAGVAGVPAAGQTDVGRITFRVAGPGVVALQEIAQPDAAVWEWNELLKPAGGRVLFAQGGKITAYGDTVEFEFATSPVRGEGWRSTVAVPRAACAAALKQARDHVAEARKQARDHAAEARGRAKL